MNTENIDKLIDHLKKVPEKAFDMRSWIIGPLNDGGTVAPKPKKARRVVETQESATSHECGTVACIGGYAVVLAVAAKDKETLSALKSLTSTTFWVAANWLSLARDDARELFSPTQVYSWERIKARHAVKVLTHFRDTGEVNWKKSGLRNLLD